MQGPAPRVRSPLAPLGCVIPEPPSVTSSGLLHSWSPVEQGSSPSGTLADPGPPLGLCSHSPAQGSGILSAGLQPLGGWARPPALPPRCRPRLKAPRSLTRGSGTLPACTARPAQADHPGASPRWGRPEMAWLV